MIALPNKHKGRCVVCDTFVPVRAGIVAAATKTDRFKLYCTTHQPTEGNTDMPRETINPHDAADLEALEQQAGYRMSELPDAVSVSGDVRAALRRLARAYDLPASDMSAAQLRRLWNASRALGPSHHRDAVADALRAELNSTTTTQTTTDNTTHKEDQTVSSTTTTDELPTIPAIPAIGTQHIAKLDALALAVDLPVSISELVRTTETAIAAATAYADALEAAKKNGGTGTSFNAREMREAGYVPNSQFDRILTYARMGRTIALTGPAGCGKTTACRYVAKALGIPEEGYFEFDCTIATTAETLIGRPGLSNGSDTYREGIVTRAFRAPRAMLVLNEVDALDPRELMALQAAFERRPNGRVLSAPEHPDATGGFLRAADPALIIVLTMNTLGNGADRAYSARNKFDAATRDRVSIIPMTYENEDAILEAHGFKTGTARAVTAWADRVRTSIANNNIPETLSTRRLIDIAEMMDATGRSLDEATLTEFYGRLDPDDARVLRAA